MHPVQIFLQKWESIIMMTTIIFKIEQLYPRYIFNVLNGWSLVKTSDAYAKHWG